MPFDGWTQGLEDPKGEGQLSRAKDGGMSEEALRTEFWRQMMEELYVGWQSEQQGAGQHAKKAALETPWEALW